MKRNKNSGIFLTDKKQGIIFICFLSLLLLLTLPLCTLPAPPAGSEIKIPAQYLGSGYLICRHGNAMLSEMIRQQNITDKRFSHIGILTRHKGKFYVIHADTNRSSISGLVKKEPLDDFLKEAGRIGIFRSRILDGRRIAADAEQFVDRPFDWKFNMENDQEIYCTELLYHIFKNNGKAQVLPLIRIENHRLIPIDACITGAAATELYDSGSRKRRTNF